jgi:hypothetical protein
MGIMHQIARDHKHMLNSPYWPKQGITDADKQCVAYTTQLFSSDLVHLLEHLPGWYLSRNKPQLSADVSALLHYISHGALLYSVMHDNQKGLIEKIQVIDEVYQFFRKNKANLFLCSFLH